ncbi:hypothetical protein [Sphingomicrobium flavum]|uniref:hypothetical protein n=1 Tax=Sphingomicrobium flavum TaxID=1229164 RepID=UPI0021ADF678|nr:hypothetical protein [Sphingomicrobium flavum]
MREGCGFAALGCGGFMLMTLSVMAGLSAMLPDEGLIVIGVIYVILAAVPLLIGWLMTRRNARYLGVTLITAAIAMGLTTLSLWASSHDPAIRELLRDEPLEVSPWLPLALTLAAGLGGWALWQKGRPPPEA